MVSRVGGLHLLCNITAIDEQFLVTWTNEYKSSFVHDLDPPSHK